MPDRTYDLTGYTVRRESDQVTGPAYIEGVAVPYNVDINYQGQVERFAPGAVTVKVGTPLLYGHNYTDPSALLGTITDVSDDQDGVRISAEVTRQDMADTLRAMSHPPGLSVGVDILHATHESDGSVTYQSAALRELSVTPVPAYGEDSPISAVRHDNQEEDMPEATEATPQVDLSPVFARIDDLDAAIARSAHVAPAANPLATYSTFAAFATAVAAGEIDQRALSDQIVSANPGVVPEGWVKDVKGIVDLGRPAVSAFGAGALPAAGLDVNYPFFAGDLATLVGAQATQKTEVTSATVDIDKGSANIGTYAGASDISYQLILRSDPSYLDAYLRIMANAYALVTDNVFADAVAAGATGSVTGFDPAATDGTVRGKVFEASVLVETATGRPASFGLAATDVFNALGGNGSLFPDQYGTRNVDGTASASTLSIQVSGIPVYHDRNLADTTMLVSNPECATWHEQGPMTATDEDVAKLGRNVAVWGMGAAALYLPAGIVALTSV